MPVEERAISGPVPTLPPLTTATRDSRTHNEKRSLLTSPPAVVVMVRALPRIVAKVRGASKQVSGVDEGGKQRGGQRLSEL